MEVKYHEDYAVLTLPEMVVIFKGADELKETLYAMCQEGINNIVLDFTNVVMIDTAGLSSLLVYQKRLKERGGRLKVTNITCSYIREMFDTIELHKVIDID